MESLEIAKEPTTDITGPSTKEKSVEAPPQYSAYNVKAESNYQHKPIVIPRKEPFCFHCPISSNGTQNPPTSSSSRLSHLLRAATLLHLLSSKIQFQNPNSWPLLTVLMMSFSLSLYSKLRTSPAELCLAAKCFPLKPSVVCCK